VWCLSGIYRLPIYVITVLLFDACRLTFVNSPTYDNTPQVLLRH